MTELWWQDAVVYQVYPRSFADADGDGTGDLDGVTDHLDHLVDLGVDAVWLTPFYVSPMADGGYDVADPCDVDPLFGDLAAFDRLLTRAHALGLRVIVDIVPNHVSSAHPWFPDRRELFWFRESDGPPNNWESAFTGPAWTELEPGVWYLHLFDTSQPDLDWDHPEVRAEFERVLRFWLDRGVDGFRIDVAMGLYKNRALTDVPPGGSDDARHGLGPVQIWNQPDVLAVYEGWNDLLAGYERDRMLVGEVYLLDADLVAPYVAPGRLHQAFNFTVLGAPYDATALQAVIQAALERFENLTWVLSNHDLVRHVTRYGGGLEGRERGLALTAFLLGLPGSPYLYQGEELGLEESDVPPDDRQDPAWLRQVASGEYTGVVGRDGCRTPIPWSDDLPGRGFTAGVPWLPFGTDGTSVAAQADDPSSVLSVYRRLLAARRDLGAPRACTWVDAEPDVLHLRRGDLDVVANLADVPKLLPPGVVLASTGDVLEGLPARTTVWLRTT